VLQPNAFDDVAYSNTISGKVTSHDVPQVVCYIESTCAKDPTMPVGQPTPPYGQMYQCMAGSGYYQMGGKIPYGADCVASPN
jgi:hypothetical protein